MAVEKFPSPLSVEEKGFLKKIAKVSKNSELLEGRQNKALYQAGQFNDWFEYVFERIPDILREFLGGVTESDWDPKEEFEDAIEKIEIVIDKIENCDPLTAKANAIVVDKNYTKYSDSELFEIAETCILRGNFSAAEDLIIHLDTVHPDNDSINHLRKKLMGSK